MVPSYSDSSFDAAPGSSELGIAVDGLGDGDKVTAVLHPGDDIIALAAQIVDLADHIAQGRFDREKGLLTKNRGETFDGMRSEG